MKPFPSEKNLIDGGISEPSRTVYTVSDLTRRIRAVIEEDVGAVWVEGEISNLSRPASGHVYFTLKDASSQLGAVLFRREAQTVNTPLREGMQVRIFGSLTVYERAGRYQIIVRRIEDSGVGVLRAAFEALKKKLQGEGLFESERKKPLPLLVRHVGVVTSPTGAAIRDILNVLTRRFPNIRVTLAPVPVQGEGAAQRIADAIDNLNALPGVEALIVGRGGGSVEDLQPFNEETVARAIARSRIPVISAVGHEVDITISDFVADVRAPTPSAAAELVVARKYALTETLDTMAQRLIRSLREAALQAHNRMLRIRERLAVQDPRRRLETGRNRLSHARLRLDHGVERAVSQKAQRLDDAAASLSYAIEKRMRDRRQRLETGRARLLAYDPMAVLRRGYSLTTDTQNRILRSTDNLQPGRLVRTRLAQGAFEAEVTTIDNHEKNETNR